MLIPENRVVALRFVFILVHSESVTDAVEAEYCE